MLRPFLKIAIAFIAISLIQSEFVSDTDNDIRDSILSSLQDKPKKELFKVYHSLYEKKYDLNSEEGIKRYRIFKSNMRFIESENAKNLGYTLGITDFTDLTEEEFRQTRLSSVMPEEFLENSEKNLTAEQSQEHFKVNYQEEDEDEMLIQKSKLNSVEEKSVTQGSKIDWAPKMNPVYDQGICGSCWAFATVHAIEGNYNIKFGKSPRFSTQQLVDCDKNNGGCQGGNMEKALDYVKSKGLALHQVYPYFSGYMGFSWFCKENKKKLNQVVSGYSKCYQNNLKEFLGRGPLIVGVDAEGNKGFQHYKGGVLDAPCKKPNHAVVLVGIDRDEKGEFLKVMNSWGTSWGEKGYFRIRRRDSDQTCFIEKFGILPEVKQISN